MADIPVLPELIELPEIITVAIEDITTGSLDGTGSFDKLMQVAKVHLQEEFTKGRINAGDYTQVYLGTMTQVLDQSMTFALTKDKTALELQILQLQYQLALLNRDKTLAEIAMIHSNIEVNNSSISMTEQQISISKDQQLNVVEERNNLVLQGLSITANTSLTTQQEAKVVEETDNLKNDNGFKI